MAEQQQFCLKWNDFHSNFHVSLDALRDDESFTDVTLSCSGRTLGAHRVILSACSNHFKDILRRIPVHQHPVIVLPTVDYDVMRAIIEFMYQGQVNVRQSQLASFLQVAESFSIQGLADEETKRTNSSSNSASAGDQVAGSSGGRSRPGDPASDGSPAPKRRRASPHHHPAVPLPSIQPYPDPLPATPGQVTEDVVVKSEGMPEVMEDSRTSDRDYLEPGEPDPMMAQAMAALAGHDPGEQAGMTSGGARDVWDRFRPLGPRQAECLQCGKMIRYHPTSVSNLRCHYRRVHPDFLVP